MDLDKKRRELIYFSALRDVFVSTPQGIACVQERPDFVRDISDRLAAGRDPEFRRMVGATGPSSESFTQSVAERWYHELVSEPFGWAIEHEGHCIGLARLHELSEEESSASVALGLYSPSDRGRGLGTEAVQLVLAYAFQVLELATLRVRVLAFNARAIRCYDRCGFKEIGREPVMLGEESSMDVFMDLAAADFKASAGTSGQSRKSSTRHSD